MLWCYTPNEPRWVIRCVEIEEMERAVTEEDRHPAIAESVAVGIRRAVAGQAVLLEKFHNHGNEDLTERLADGIRGI